jgi:hypothetical protein
MLKVEIFQYDQETSQSPMTDSNFHRDLLNSHELGAKCVTLNLPTKRNCLTDADIEFIERPSLSVATLQGRHARNEPAFRISFDHYVKFLLHDVGKITVRFRLKTHLLHHVYPTRVDL